MKTLNYKKLAIEIAATIVVLGFITLAVIHVIHLIQINAIDWSK